jgi:hypothetical protein
MALTSDKLRNRRLSQLISGDAMKFYDCATAPSPRRVRIFLAEKGTVHACVSSDQS